MTVSSLEASRFEVNPWRFENESGKRVDLEYIKWFKAQAKEVGGQLHIICGRVMTKFRGRSK